MSSRDLTTPYFQSVLRAATVELTLETRAPRHHNALQQRAELLDGKPCVARNSAHRERVDRIMARNGHDALAVAHDNVLPLTHDPKTGLFECAHGVEMIDAGDLGQG